MPYSKQLYYVDKKNVAEYSDTPKSNSTLNVTRLIRGLKAWRKKKLSTSSKPKTLILSDWTAATWDELKISEVRKKLAQMMKDGFTVYIWQDGKLLQLKDIELLADASIRKKITPAFDDEIFTIATQYKIPRRKICLVDDYQLAQLFGEPPESPRLLDVFDFKDTKHDKNKIKAILERAEPPLGAWLESRYLKDYLKYEIKNLQAQWPTLPTVSRFRSIDLTSYMFVYDTNEFISAIRKTDISKLESLSLASAERLSAYGKSGNTIFKEDMESFFQKQKLKPAIKSLSLNKFDFLSHAITCFNWQHLNTLNLCYTEENTLNILAALTQSPIQSLRLNSIIYSPAVTESIEQFVLLEKLILFYATIDVNDFITLLQRKHHLKVLGLAYCQFYAEEFDSNVNLKLEKLEELDLSQTKFSVKILEVLLRGSPNLKKLCARYQPHFIELFSSPTNLQLKNLETLDLSGNNAINSEAFENIVKSTPNLKKLNLDGRNLGIIGQFSSSIHLELEKLETLSFSHTSINTIGMESCKALLRSAPNLKELDLTKTGYGGVVDEESHELLRTIPHVIGYEPNRRNRAFISDITTENTPARSLLTSQTHVTNSIDTNTTYHPGKNFNLKRVFFAANGGENPAIEKYRLEIVGDVSLSANRDNRPEFGFGSTRKNDADLQNRTDLVRHNTDVFSLVKCKNNKSNLFYGKQTFTLNVDWQPIASLSPAETITDYHLSPNGDGIEIKYFPQDNLYYIHSTSGQKTITLDFLVQRHQAHQPQLRADIQNLVNQFKAFPSNPDPRSSQLILPQLPQGQRHTEESIIREMLHQKLGACRHRAVAFKLLMKQRHPSTRVRLIGNDCHMFAEVQQEGQWLCCDLGGYFAGLSINESAQPNTAFTSISNAADSASAASSIPIPSVSASASASASAITETQLRYISEQQRHFEARLATWKTEGRHDTTIKSYIQHIFTDQKKKHLIELPFDRIQDLNNAIQTQARDTHRPIFYIDSPEDLICSAKYVKMQPNQTGIICEGPGGRLYDFLTAQRDLQQENAPILLINYANFPKEDIAKCHKLLEPEPTVDGISLPPNMHVIGFIDPKHPKCYKGRDLTARFRDKGTIHQCPLALLPENTPVLSSREESTDISDRTVINLYHSSEWQTLLTGGWIMQNGQLRFEEGALIKALRENKPIDIQNPPQAPEDPDDPHETDEKKAFELFWQQAKLDNAIYVGDQKIELQGRLEDPNFICVSEGYSWNNCSQVTWVETPDEEAIILNPSLLTRFFSDYEYEPREDEGYFNKVPGVLATHAEKNPEKPLSIYLTRSLNEDEWAKLLDESQKHHVFLSIACAPDVTVPEVLGVVPKSSFFNEETASANFNNVCLVSNDPDLTVAQLTINNTASDHWIVLDVSECGITDLWIKPIQISQEDFTFKQTNQALVTALNEGKKVILTGEFSNELLDNLAPILQERIRFASETSGQLVLVNKNPISFMPTINLNLAQTREEKQHALLTKGFTQSDIKRLQAEEPDCLEVQPFIKLLTRLSYLRTYPHKNSTDAWHGLNHHADLSPITISAFNPDESEVDTITFIQERIDAVEEALQDPLHPTVFITGLTGVGKTSFFEKEFGKANRTMYFGEDDAKKIAWAEDDTTNEKILFIDEANLSCEHQWSEFEGLFHTPPTIRIGEKIYYLTPHHKVIFAGNPLSYGDRELFPLFARHGNTVEFKPLPCAFIYERLIKPVFENTHIAPEQVQRIAVELFSVYQHLVELSADEVLMSPREVQMMALLVSNYYRRHPNLTAEALIEVAQHYARTMGYNLVPDIDHQRKKFERQFPYVPLTQVITKTHQLENSNFFPTESRLPVLQHLQDLITLREHRRELQKNAHNEGRPLSITEKTQCYGGLGGLIIEGEPGIGKSEMVKYYLSTNGYRKGNPKCFHKPTESEKIFYDIPLDMDPDAQKALLLKAFHEGAVVIMDEINSTPLMEKLLNSLLMGKSPEGDPPEQPGFTLIGTQNPISMEGRSAASTALSRRMQMCYLPRYPENEILEILRQKRLPASICHDLLNAFQAQCQKAKKEGLEPSPTYRDLVPLIQELVTAQEKALESGQSQHAAFSVPDATDPSSASNHLSATASSFFGRNAPGAEDMLSRNGMAACCSIS